MLSSTFAKGWSFVALALIMSLAGCGDAGQGEQLGKTESPITYSPDLFANDQAAFDYFVGKGLTNFQAAGIVGNLDQESGMDPTISQYGGGPGRGIAQWSAGGRWDTDTNDNATWYAAKQGQSVWSLQLQLDFIWYELTTFSSYGLAALKASTNVTAATVAFETDFEGCGACNESQRVAYAQSVLSAYGSVSYAAQYVSQSFPFASTTLTMVAGQVIPSYIELKNTGTKAWDTNTRIGTTQPRDRKSAFADGTWIASNRPAAVTGTVAPGGTYKFQFDLAAPNTPGTYDEFFGVLEEGVAWFSDSGQGGPPDNQLEVKITVVAPEGGLPVAEAGAGDDGGPVAEGDGGPVAQGEGGVVVESDGGLVAQTDGGGDLNAFGTAGSSGCSVGGPSRGQAPPWVMGLGLAVVVGTVARFRRRAPSRRRR